jgi:hypothetical protein
MNGFDALFNVRPLFQMLTDLFQQNQYPEVVVNADSPFKVSATFG